MLGDYREGTILLSTILIIIAITMFQYQRTEKALFELNKLAISKVMVYRDKELKWISSTDLVIDDIVKLTEGCTTPLESAATSQLNGGRTYIAFCELSLRVN